MRRCAECGNHGLVHRPRIRRSLRWMLDRYFAFVFTHSTAAFMDLARRALIDRHRLKQEVRRLEAQLAEATADG